MSHLLSFPPRPTPKPGADHIFVNNVRFWSMFAIIALHAGSVLNVSGGDASVFQQAISAPIKFGTIAFFLISGFLLGERVESSNPFTYFTRRLQRVFLPWLLWFAVSFCALFLLHPSWNAAALASGKSPLLVVAHWVRLDLFSTAFWFVPNLLCALALILVFRKSLDRLRMGAALGLINAFYIVNVYTAWIPNRHTEAMFGFVFYLWLGAFAARHQARLRSVVEKTPLVPLLALAVVTCLMSFAESRLLTSLGNADPTNTLRGSNQLFSIVMVLLFLKVPRAIYPRFVNVRDQTFGLYLSHSLFLIVMRGILENTVSAQAFSPFWETTPGELILWSLNFVVTYATCLLLCKWLAGHARLRWTIGAFTRNAPTATPVRSIQRPALGRMIRT